MAKISHFKCYFGKFAPSFPLSVSARTYIETNFITISSLWYGNDMVVVE